MSLELTRDAIADSRDVFALAPSITAVILHSDLPAVAKHRGRLRGVVATRVIRAVDEVLGQARAGDLPSAKALATADSGALPRVLWWVESEAELASHLSKLRELATRHRLAVGYDVDLIHERVALVQLWLD